MKKLLFAIALLTVCSVNMNILYGQNINSNDSISRGKHIPEFTVAVQPFMLINGGLRLDFEKRLHNPNHWLQVGITGYYLPELTNTEEYYNIGFDDEDMKGLKGFGFNGSYKILLPSVSKCFYVMGNLSYTLSQVKYMDIGYLPFIEDGMKFYEYSKFMDTQTFNKVGANAIIGLQSSVEKKVFIDFYLGLGYNYSFYNENKAHFDETMFSYGYRGVVVVAGMRFGFAF